MLRPKILNFSELEKIKKEQILVIDRVTEVSAYLLRDLRLWFGLLRLLRLLRLGTICFGLSLDLFGHTICILLNLSFLGGDLFLLVRG